MLKGGITPGFDVLDIDTVLGDLRAVFDLDGFESGFVFILSHLPSLRYPRITICVVCSSSTSCTFHCRASPWPLEASFKICCFTARSALAVFSSCSRLAILAS